MKIEIPQKWRPLIALVALIACLTATTGFQGNGPVSSSQIAFSAATAPGVSATFQNFGQASHWLTYCPNANVAGIQIELDGSYDGTNWFSISPPGTTIGPGCTTLEAGGYYANIHANLVSISGAGANVSAYYSASTFAIPDGGIGQTGKSSQPVTYLASGSGSILVTSCSYNAIFAGPQVLYGASIMNEDPGIVFVELNDNASYDAIYQVAGNSTTQIVLPTVGVQIGPVSLRAKVCTTPNGPTAPANQSLLTFYTKPNPIITTQAGPTGIVAFSRKGGTQ